jgi:hypothetical protein
VNGILFRQDLMTEDRDSNGLAIEQRSQRVGPTSLGIGLPVEDLWNSSIGATIWGTQYLV